MSRKKGKNKGKASAKNTPRKSTPSSRRQLSSHAWSPQVPAETMSKFSLADEARWMSNHRTGAFETGKKLRNMPVNFVSAGHLEGTIKEKNKLMAAESEADSDSDVDVESLTPSSHVSSPAADNTHAMANMAIRSPSPAESQTSSSADEVVFRGRAQPPATPSSKSHGKASSVTTAAAVPEEASATTSIAIEISMTGTAREDVMDAESDDDNRSVIQDGFAERRGDRPAWEGTTTPWVHRSKPGIGWDPLKRQRGMEANAERQNPHDTAMDDYLQNIQDFGLTDSSSAPAFAGRTMDLDADSYSEGGSDIDVSNFDDGWDSDMIRDFDDLSTSYDEQETLVVDILSKRSRESGLQYLCVREGFGADEATWRLSTSLLSGPEKRLVRAFEDESHRKSLLGISDPSETDSDNGRHGSEDGYGDEDEDEDEYEEDFSDETIARVLQKQEELGLGSRDLVLYPGDPIFRRELDPHISIGGFEKPSKKRQDRVRGRGNRDPTFPSASAMADALAMDPYGGFDIMDTERPSLRHRKKGRRGPMPPELDDEDLNGQLQRAWAADRDKKRIKKAEREELRQQGLLGRKGKGPNLKVKYQGGIAMEDILEEIREFLMGDMQSLALPPMEASRRATIHQAAAFFNLTSRSRGDGQDRFTVLAKTSRTRLWTDDEYDIAIQRKGFQKRLRGPLHGQGGGRSSKTAKVRFGNRVRPQTGYQEGDTVGANAPELGPENKGHALLSKMGWSKGTGLGALDNKGILQPIAHTVKMNKAGLK